MARLRLRPSSREKELSTKGHEGRRRATKGLEESQEGSAKGWEGGKDFQEGAKRYPRRATKNGEGPLRGWRRLKKDLPKVGQGEKISRKGQKDIHEGPRRTAKGHEGVGERSRGACQRSGSGSAKGLQGVGRDSKGVREGPRRKTRREKRYPRRTLGLSTKGTRIQEDQKIVFPAFGLSVEHESMFDSHRWTGFFLSILNALFIHVQKSLIALSPLGRRQP